LDFDQIKLEYKMLHIYTHTHTHTGVLKILIGDAEACNVTLKDVK
jgi:hypothetical protein